MQTDPVNVITLFLSHFKWRGVVALVVAGVFLLRAWVTGYQITTLQAALQTREGVGIAVVAALSLLAFLVGPMLRPVRWLLHRGIACPSAFAVPRNVTAGEANHECVVIRLDNQRGTLSLWVRLQRSGEGIRGIGNHYLLAHSAGYAACAPPVPIADAFTLYRYQPEGQQASWCVQFSRGASTCRNVIAVADDEARFPPGWHHFVLTWDLRTGPRLRPFVRLYIDGECRAEDLPANAEAASYPLAAGPVPLLIGTWTDLQAVYYASAKLGWFKYYGSALRPDTVARLYGFGPPEAV